MAHFDLFVIGGGSGGVACARRSASHGARVGIAEGNRMGGTCVIRGCVPKKLMHYGSHFADTFKVAKTFGWQFPEPRHQFLELLEARNREIQRLNGIYIKMLQNAGVTIFAAYAKLVSGRDSSVHAIEVEGERHTADHVLVAVGGKPSLPDIPGIEHTVTSDSILEDLYEFPKRFAVVGAGYIGTEIACIMNGFGAETTMVLRGDEPLRGFDSDLRKRVTAGMEHNGIQIRPSTVVKSISKESDCIRLHTNVGSINADLVLYATGRSPVPNTKDIGLTEAGVKMNEQGAIYVDATFETNVKSIFAVGDCADHAGNGQSSAQFDLTPVAVAEGRVIAETLFNDNPHSVAYDSIPTAIFSVPQASTAGMSEDLAKSYGFDISVYMADFRPMLYTLGDIQERTFMKVIVDNKDDTVLGCSMVGDDAAEIMQGLAVALTAGAKKADFDKTVGIHPSAAEEFVTMYQPRVEYS